MLGPSRRNYGVGSVRIKKLYARSVPIISFVCYGMFFNFLSSYMYVDSNTHFINPDLRLRDHNTELKVMVHEGVVEDVAWHLRHEYLFGSVGDDQYLLVWDLRTPSVTKPVRSCIANSSEELRALIYAGSGIVEGSNPYLEWDELDSRHLSSPSCLNWTCRSQTKSRL
ncbi:WD-40 repeat-containing protein MSI1 [Trifolium repens]|nr:WD-40 repeat-containing protein MSI1 [Trifolium repens]